MDDLRAMERGNKDVTVGASGKQEAEVSWKVVGGVDCWSATPSIFSSRHPP